MVSKLDFTLQPGQSLKQRFVTENISPRVSIITPFYNTLEHFEQMYNSVLNQTFPWFEWIIVDDGSTDQKALEQLEKTCSTRPTHNCLPCGKWRPSNGTKLWCGTGRPQTI